MLVLLIRVLIAKNNNFEGFQNNELDMPPQNVEIATKLREMADILEPEMKPEQQELEMKPEMKPEM